MNDKPNLMERPDIEIYKIWPTQFDRELFIDIIQLGRQELRKKYRQHFYAIRDKVYDYNTVPRLLSGYGFFYDRIKNSVDLTIWTTSLLKSQSLIMERKVMRLHHLVKKMPRLEK